LREWKTSLSKGEPELTLILIHGSPGSSTSLHPLGKALSAERIFVYAPDIRGHGKTGRKEDIDYPQQLSPQRLCPNARNGPEQ
jgi:pimeloyl-ACP methyl ester carboxylesterase